MSPASAGLSLSGCARPALAMIRRSFLGASVLRITQQPKRGPV